MLAPDFRRCRVKLIFSFKVILLGKLSNAEEPPETRKIIKSSLPLLCTNRKAALAALTLALSGKG